MRERGRGGPLRVRRSVAVSGVAPAARSNAERAKAVRARDEAFSARVAAQAVAQASAFDRAAGATPLTATDRRTRNGPPRPRSRTGRSPISVWAPRVVALGVLALIIVVVLTMLRGVL